MPGIDIKELSFNKFLISVHPELVEGSCHRTSTSSVRTESDNENREVIQSVDLERYYHY